MLSHTPRELLLPRILSQEIIKLPLPVSGKSCEYDRAFPVYSYAGISVFSRRHLDRAEYNLVFSKGRVEQSLDLQ